MRTRLVGSLLLYGVFFLVLATAGCRHRVAVQAPAPAAPATVPEQPQVTLEASPTSIERGQSVTLRWSSTNATSLTVYPDVGTVEPEGSMSTMPADSTTYTITATGPGGTASATAYVAVAVPEGTASTVEFTLEDLFLKEVQDAYFDYDKADIRPEARNQLSKTADFLRSYPQVQVIIEGHCDERGSTEYNLALGDRRAQAAENFLAALGIPAGRMRTVSYGKERPFCNNENEGCWQQNRRAHFSMAK